MNATKKILDYFKENTEVFAACIEELDIYNGYLNGERLCPMDSFNDYLAGEDQRRLACMVYYGEFCPADDYFYFDGYGNLGSTDYPADYYEKYIDHWAVDEMKESRSYVPSIDSDMELSELFDELEEEAA